MEYFDLNIPYTAGAKSSKTRLLVAAKAMELGYAAVAYNHTIKGVMSESHRCSIPLFPLSSFLDKLSSSPLSSSINLHRQLLGVSSAPFRQYTRLTVVVDSPSQAADLNSGNAILKTYDIVAVCPLNQNAFDQACLNAQVDIIYIDFSDKLPFRLKQPLVQAAIKRGVYFEITYSNLILGVQARRQMISNAKLLVDWTRGKNLIFSSGAPALTELRGPYDVANLSSLLGLSFERAKPAISKNCRSLIANALRRKHYYKEAIKVESLPAGGQTKFVDWLNWDPISSGEGDLVLDDLEKSFSTSGDVSKTAKAIDFASAVNGLPSHGLQIMDVISITKAAPEPSAVCEKPATPQEVAVADSCYEISEQLCSHSKFQPTLQNMKSVDQISTDIKTEISSSLTCNMNESVGVAEKGFDVVANESPKSSKQLDPIGERHFDLHSQSSIDNSERNVIRVDNRTATTCIHETETVTLGGQCAPSESPTLSKDLTITRTHSEESKILNIFRTEICTESVHVGGTLTETDNEANYELPATKCDVSLCEETPAKENLKEGGDPSLMFVDEMSVKSYRVQPTTNIAYSTPKELPSTSCEVSMNDGLVNSEEPVEARGCSVVNYVESPSRELYDAVETENGDLVMNDESAEESNVGSQTLMKIPAGRRNEFPADPPPGRGGLKRKAPRRSCLLPFKPFLRSRPFKKKARKLRHN